MLTLATVSAVQWDARSSRGRLGTFTDRWEDFVSGLGPAPTARPTTKRFQAPTAALRVEVPGGSSPSGRGFPHAPNNVQGNEVTVLHNARPGSAPSTMIMQRFRPNPYYPAALTTRNVPAQPRGTRAASARPGTARPSFMSPQAAPLSGHPAGTPDGMSSYSLWTSRENLPTETVSGSLALEVELLRERLQKQTDVAARAEAALAQLAGSSRTQHVGMSSQIEVLQAELAEARDGKAEVEAEYERLRTERHGLKTEIAELKAELRQVKAEVQQERNTVATQVSSQRVFRSLGTVLRVDEFPCIRE